MSWIYESLLFWINLEYVKHAKLSDVIAISCDSRSGDDDDNNDDSQIYVASH